MKITPLRCPNCSASLKIKKMKLQSGEVVHCTHCGFDFVLEREHVQTPPARSGSWGRYQPPQSKNAPAVGIIGLLVVLSCMVVFMLRLADVGTHKPGAALPDMRTAPESKPVQAFVEAVFRKPAADVTPDELASIRYLDIALTKYFVPEAHGYWPEDGSEAWAFTYSFEDYYAGAADFEATRDTVFVPYNTGTNADWTDLQCFTGLTWLETNRCSDIVGSWRTSLAGLTGLKHFGSGFNQDTSEVAENLADPSQIRSLSVGLRTQHDVDALAAFTNLEELTINYIFADRVENMNAISVLGKLQTLNLDTVQDVSWISVLPTVTTLRLTSANMITDFSVLYGMPALEVLELEQARELRDIGFVKNMPKLHTLRLAYSDVMSLEPLRGHIALVDLELMQNSNLQNVGALETLTSLQRLSINRVPDSFPSLSALQHLRSVTIPINALPGIKGLTGITELNLLDAFRTTVNGAALAAFPALETLTMKDVDNFENLNALRQLPLLKTVRIIDMSISRADDFGAVFNLPHLETLEFRHCGVGMDVTRLNPSPDMRTLSLVNCWLWRYYDGGSKVEDGTGATRLLPVLQTMTGLQTLELTDAMIEDIAFVAGMTELETLNIAENYVMDAAILLGSPKLRTLYCMQNPVQNLAVLPETVRVYK